MSLLNRGLRYWLPYYLLNKIRRRERTNSSEPVHLFICIVDHFEPFTDGADFKTALSRVQAWCSEYPAFANRHRDAEGRPLQHTWFYPPHHDQQMLPYLVELCQQGYGEIEMHLHHNRMEPFPDTSESLREKILQCIEDYGKYGIFRQPEGKPRFAFIHGDWSLDNSGGDHLCGVNDELTILRECGCYADFTFPTLNKSQPAMANALYYAVDDQTRPKSYNHGIPVVQGKKAPDTGLMIVQGILGIRYDVQKRLKFAIEYSDLDLNDPPSPNRVDYWVKNALTVRGKPNWKFIKLHTHGAPEFRWGCNFGKSADSAFSYLEKAYNDNKRYVLHYVTAREVYNYIKKVELGQFLNPLRSPDCLIPPYPYVS